MTAEDHMPPDQAARLVQDFTSAPEEPLQATSGVWLVPSILCGIALWAALLWPLVRSLRSLLAGAP